MKETKVYKIFQPPNVEVRVLVSEEMIEDIKNCKEDPDFCENCSWWDVQCYHEPMCWHLKERIQKEGETND